MEITYSKSNQLKRKVNLVFQTLLVTIIFINGINEIIPLKLIIWQTIHFSLIALADHYLDDYPDKKQRIVSLLLLSYLFFLVLSLFFGIFDELYMRIHGMILIFGNLFGNKVDKPFWMILTFLNLMILISVEIIRNEFLLMYKIATIYIIGAICLLAVTERLSESNKNFWILHAIILFLWVIFEGPFYQEAFIFLIGGISYESLKILMNKMLEKNANTSYEPIPRKPAT